MQKNISTFIEFPLSIRYCPSHHFPHVTFSCFHEPLAPISAERLKKNAGVALFAVKSLD